MLSVMSYDRFAKPAYTSLVKLSHTSCSVPFGWPVDADLLADLVSARLTELTAV